MKLFDKDVKIYLFMSSGHYKFAYLLKCVCNPYVSICGVLLWSFMDKGRAEEKIWACIPSLGRTRWHCLLESALTLLEELSGCVYLLSVTFSHWSLYKWFCCLKWPISIMLKCYLLFISSRRLWCASERTWLLDEIPWVMNCNAVEHEFSVNESTISIKCGVLK